MCQHSFAVGVVTLQEIINEACALHLSGVTSYTLLPIHTLSLLPNLAHTEGSTHQRLAVLAQLYAGPTQRPRTEHSPLLA